MVWHIVRAALVAGGLLGGAGVLGGTDVAGAAATGTADAARIGVVDMQAVITQSAKGQRARGQLQSETEAKQKEMSAREEEVRKLQTELEQQRAVLSAAALREKEESIQRKIRDIRRLGEDAERDLRKREAELVGDIQRDAMEVIAEYGKEKGFSIILERASGVWYVSDRTDLTKEIIDRYNAKAKAR